ncbi:hypothetical protein DFQ28_006367 [Apophysomyces sp. BC1034]|nr:hypothetical protein DFQ30_006286 [Apophysomyces sp. BC1015]KAG0177206.1 hypothetical protein DFQ29_005104 [Apophysomyces sp. BC1021]KAG0187437.1 hypothetical protein DFQ28_006367 [Apophysomyces sp. BC1034]
MPLDKPVLIIGGGMAGLSLAHALKQQGVPYRLFERDQNPNHRAQGWSMSLHFCLDPLKKAIDPAHYDTLTAKALVNPRDPATEFAVIDGRTLETLVRFDQHAMLAANFTAYRINRTRFRQWLLEQIDVEWDQRLQSYAVGEDGVTITMEDGKEVQGSILVGADGVNSVVCEQLIGSEEFARTTTVTPVRVLAAARWVDKKGYELVKSFSSTLFMAHGRLETGEIVAMFVAINDISADGDQYQVLWSLSRYDPEGILPQQETNEGRLNQAKAWAREAFVDNLSQLVLDSPPDTITAEIKVRERPPHETLKANSTNGRVTLVGDAAHPMTMFRGEGGNHAILDSMLLATQLIEAHQDKKSLRDAVDAYLAEMIPRGSNAVLESHQACELTHKSPEYMIKMRQSMIEQVKTGHDATVENKSV